MVHTDWYFVAMRLPLNGLVHADAETVVAITAGSSHIDKVSRFDFHPPASRIKAVASISGASDSRVMLFHAIVTGSAVSRGSG